MGRAILVNERMGVTTGPMYRVTGSKKGSKMKGATISDLDVLFHAILKRVQTRFPKIINVSVKVEDEYSVKRSLRRGSTSESQNQQVPREVIEANNRWRKHMRAHGMLPSMSMIERYSDAKASLPALVRYSESL